MPRPEAEPVPADQAIEEEQLPIVNCHAHVFTGDYVPPLLGKSLLIFPINYIANIQWLIKLTRWWRPIAEAQDKTGQKRIVVFAIIIRNLLDTIKGWIKWLLSIPGVFPLSQVLEIWLTLEVLKLVWHMIGPDTAIMSVPDILWLPDIVQWIFDLPIYFVGKTWQNIAIILAAFMFFGMTRRLMLQVAKIFVSIPGKMSRDLIQRYWQLMEYTKYQHQVDIYDRLKDQYPPNSQFVLLPMDMKYMRAGTMPAIPHEYKVALRGLQRKYRIARQRPLGDPTRKPDMRKYKDLINKRKNKMQSLQERDPFYFQLERLEAIKRTRGNLVHPFIFAHPQRIREEQDFPAAKERLFHYRIENEQFVLEDCKIKSLMYGRNPFAGIKIYPALGYYPFDIDLLPLWRFCADRGIPIMTHCIKGTIFWRGMKEWDWNRHPVFIDPKNPDKGLRLPEIRGMNYSLNFTHPMNYLCLLDEFLLRKWLTTCINNHEVAETKKDNLKALFGYTDENTALTNPLNDLKICLGHFGGDEHWQRYESEDRQQHTSALFHHPNYGINLTHNASGEFSNDKIEQMWWRADWFSIICSMMLQHRNLYADISYILHNNQIYPLLKRIISHERNKELPAHLDELPRHRLGERVLFGTDFYVVRSNNADRDLLHEAQAALDTAEFDQIARLNPHSYLQMNLYP